MAEDAMEILVVDDSQLNLTVAEDVLKTTGYRLNFATSGEAALKIAFVRGGIDLILLDIMMPGMDGLEVCRRLKGDPRTAEIPIIFITAKTDKKTILEAFEAGGVDYITKPFNIKEMLARVETHLKLRASHKRLERANLDLRRSQNRLQSFLQNVDDLVCFRDLKGNPMMVNHAYTLTTGINQIRLKVHPLSWRQLLFPDDLETIDRFFNEHPNGAARFEIEYRMKDTKGDWRWIHTRMVGIPGAQEGQFSGYHCIERDITDRKQQEEQNLRHMTLMFEHATEAMMVSDLQGNIVNVNPAFCALTGYELTDVLGRNVRLLQSDRHDAEFYRRQWGELERHGFWQGEVWNRGKERVFPARQSTVAERDDANKVLHYVTVFSDLTQEKLSEERIRQLANYDGLTGLPNRTLFSRRLAEQLAREIPEGHQGAVLFIGMDRFEAINESLGHSSGDGLLQEAATRLQSLVGGRGLVARLGGDEFAVLVEPTNLPHSIPRMGEDCLDAFRQPFSLFGSLLVVTVSIGITFFPRDGAEPEGILKNAEKALRKAKAAGRDTLQTYSAEPGGGALSELILESQLRQAIARRELHVFYQPQINLKYKNLVGGESLMRWIRPGGDMISPGVFIPIAERSGQIVEMGEWALNTVCAQIRDWHAQKGFDGRIAVNLSSIQIQKGDIVQTVRKAITDARISGRHLELEITESIFLRDPAQVVEIIRAFRAMDILVALDDFGTGYSSLSYLKKLPVDKMKIDQSFVRDLERDPGDRAIIQTIIALGKNLGLRTIAEGIETPGQFAFLRDNGCDEGQGFLHGKPKPADQFLI